MKKIVGIIAFIFFVFLGVILVENYGVNHKTQIIVKDTCIIDSTKADSLK